MQTDPLAFLTPQPLVDILQPYCEKIGFRYLAPHLHEIFLAFSFYQMLFLLSGLLSPQIWPKQIRALSPKNRIDFDIHVVSQFQALIVVPLAFFCFNDPILSANIITAYTPWTGFLGSLATGYFVWDLIICARYVNLFGVGFLLHAICALFVFVQGFRPYVMGMMGHFLMFEMSTPFVNMNWFVSRLPKGTFPSWFEAANGIALMTVFFGCRMIWGNYWSYVTITNMWKPEIRPLYPFWLPILNTTSNLTLVSLNFFWFSKMVRILIKKINGSKKELKEDVHKQD
ncbi:Topoisomerase I damage affected protein 4 [Yarrowia sp. C11]|nr:Topoisomerase I damage affected protein 4 [Yarrowia sp. E02]KAG5371679.1 Topoisomerase I damage affected protein 4 [Yarrowia sp. C11]